MEQQIQFADFGPSAPGVIEWRRATDQPANIVAICEDEAHAVRLSLQFAKSRYGYTAKDVAALMGVQRSRLTEWQHTERRMPEKHRRMFMHATGCALLRQYTEKAEADRWAKGGMTRSERDRAIVALMVG